ncbi:DNA repair protein RecO [Candidatus Mycosynbacter amalyticus]|uniref:DNA repair protein RecO n=1 Tax=Candidatus Mycosynbacter amalyticus TaxID=2665156 RepID=A0A857MJ18_9BACT|nr:DNA repair protein RecO [Candidatus Mycosynbacter amalyticus]QHN42564.1 DNA repair protein RecO [Candidatus Mycosynbacter amalyticus]
MKPERTQAIVLRRTDYGESDRILQLITPLGKRSAMARGVRKPRSKLAGGVELLAESEVLLRPGKGELMVLSSARMVTFYRQILADYDRLQFAYEVLKLVSRASEHADSSEWFTVTKEVLAGLDDPSTSSALTKAWFYIQYARLMGDELSTQRDALGELLRADQTYRYNVGEKALVPHDAGDITANHIKVLRLLAERPLHVARHVSGLSEYLIVVAATAHQHAATD